jgi:hypothetical protein
MRTPKILIDNNETHRRDCELPKVSLISGAELPKDAIGDEPNNRDNQHYPYESELCTSLWAKRKTAELVDFCCSVDYEREYHDSDASPCQRDNRKSQSNGDAR